MGKMKEIFIEMQEKEETQNYLEDSSVFDSGILCPNCFKSNLLEYSAEDLYCETCAQEFIKINNSIKFK